MLRKGPAEEVKINAKQLKSEQRKILDNPPIELSLERIIRHPTTTKLEHHVASWATTMAIQVFQEVNNDKDLHQWIFTPEQRDEQSGKIPDLVVEKVLKETDDKPYAIPWLCMEFKKLGGDPPYKALHQITTAVKGKLDEEITNILTIYLVVVVGILGDGLRSDRWSSAWTRRQFFVGLQISSAERRKI